MKNIALFLLVFLSGLIYGQAQPYLLLISFDGFRWDYLNRDITPNLDEVIQNGVRYVIPSTYIPF